MEDRTIGVLEKLKTLILEAFKLNVKIAAQTVDQIKKTGFLLSITNPREYKTKKLIDELLAATEKLNTVKYSKKIPFGAERRNKLVLEILELTLELSVVANKNMRNNVNQPQTTQTQVNQSQRVKNSN